MIPIHKKFNEIVSGERLPVKEELADLEGQNFGVTSV
jgi:hypothetical protein